MNKKKFCAILLSLVLVLLPNYSFADRIVGEDDNVKGYIIGVEDSGESLYEKNADEVMPIASMSKIMTYVVVREALDRGEFSLDDEVKVSKNAAELNSWEYSALGLEEDMKIKVNDLLKGLIVVSGNDCAVALAELVAGSEKDFVKLMNEKAEELGLETQTYYNASGIQSKDNKQNSSSARDLFRLSKYAIEKYPELLQYSSMKQIDINTLDIHKPSVLPLVGEIDGVDGLKTGTTEEAGYCIITTCDMQKLDSKDKFRTIAVVMGASSNDVRKSAATDLIYYVSRYFDLFKIADTKEKFENLKMNSAQKGYVSLYPTENLTIIKKNDDRISENVNINEDEKAPIKKGDVMGNVTIKYNDMEYDIDLVANEDQGQATKFTRVIRSLKDACNFLIECLIAS